MRRMLVPVLMVWFSFSLVLPVHAYTNYGLGAKTCGTWLSKRKGNDWYDMGQWMLGFISAAGYYGKNLRESEGEAFGAWMDNFCTQNPLSQFDEGVKTLVNQLSQ